MKPIMKRIYTLFIISSITIGFTGCSLLKVSVSTGEPLTEKENDIRMTTRGFYHTFQSQVILAADSIIKGTDDPTAKIHAVRWKLEANPCYHVCRPQIRAGTLSRRDLGTLQESGQDFEGAARFGSCSATGQPSPAIRSASSKNSIAANWQK